MTRRQLDRRRKKLFWKMDEARAAIEEMERELLVARVLFAQLQGGLRGGSDLLS